MVISVSSIVTDDVHLLCVPHESHASQPLLVSRDCTSSSPARYDFAVTEEEARVARLTVMPDMLIPHHNISCRDKEREKRWDGP